MSELSQVLESKGFKLTKWFLNSRAVLSSAASEEQAKPFKGLELNSNTQLPIARALGVFWNTNRDILGFQIERKTLLGYMD